MEIAPWIKQQENYDGSSIIKPGTLIVGRYLVEKRVGGCDSVSNVYLAYDQQRNTSCALKEIFYSYSDGFQFEKPVEYFLRASEQLASFDHPSIPRLFDYFIVEKKAYFLVSKFIEGETFFDLLKAAPDEKLDEWRVTEWAIQICDALAYLHTRQPPIVYRDLKLSHFMLDKSNQVILVDFGIARLVPPPKKEEKFGLCSMWGKGLVPPEIFAGRIEPRSDIYMLGAMMFHLLTGNDPDDNPLFVFDFTRWPRPCQINPELSEGMDKIIIKAVEHKPVNRYESALEMKKVLEEHLSQIDSTMNS
jgi:serine/threonine-protein kinase